MIQAVEIAFTVLPVTDINQGRAFYETVLGLKPTSVFVKGAMGFVEYEIGGGTLAIGCGAPLFKPSKDGGAIALEVRDFDAAITALKAANCRFLQEPGETPVCHMATIADPDGNFIMIHHRKAGAESAGH